MRPSSDRSRRMSDYVLYVVIPRFWALLHTKDTTIPVERNLLGSERVAVAVLQPAAGQGLAAARQQPVPVAVQLLLRVALHHQRGGVVGLLRQPRPPRPG